MWQELEARNRMRWLQVVPSPLKVTNAEGAIRQGLRRQDDEKNPVGYCPC